MAGTCPFQRFGAFFEGDSGGAQVVDEENVAPLIEFRRRLEGVDQIGAALGPAQLELRRCRSYSKQALCLDGSLDPDRQGFRQEKRLIVAPFPLGLWMQGDRH